MGAKTSNIQSRYPRKGDIQTILVVDDNEAILDTVVAILQHENFRVLSANSGPAAVRLAETHEAIDLLLSDVEMPEMSGPDLGELLKKVRPDLHVMLMSGGANGNLLVLNYGWAYIQKPLVAAKLVEMVREVLHSEIAPSLAAKSSTVAKISRTVNIWPPPGAAQCQGSPPPVPLPTWQRL